MSDIDEKKGNETTVTTKEVDHGTQYVRLPSPVRSTSWQELTRLYLSTAPTLMMRMRLRPLWPASLASSTRSRRSECSER